MSAPTTFLLDILLPIFLWSYYTIVVLDTPDFPAYSRILLKLALPNLRTIIVIAVIDQGLKRSALLFVKDE